MAVDKRNKIGALVCGVLCAVCVAAYTGSVRAEADEERARVLAEYGGDQVEVCVATRNIAAGETIGESAVEMKRWVADLLPQGSLTSVNDVVGKQATSPILAGEVVSSQRFSALSSSFDIPAGLVAVSVSAKEVQAVGGALLPGARVDLYAAGNSSTAVIAQDVLVLATSSCDASGAASGAALSWVALAVPPELVEQIIAAEQKTQLYFALPGAQKEAALTNSTGVSPDTSQETPSANAQEQK